IKRDNLRKQAAQIRYCILQGKEYFTAARHVGIATRPNLLYYGLSALAQAIILLRGGGTYSFDYIRSKGQIKGHHGLELISPPRNGVPPVEAAASFRSKPHLRG